MLIILMQFRKASSQLDYIQLTNQKLLNRIQRQQLRRLLPRPFCSQLLKSTKIPRILPTTMQQKTNMLLQ